MQWQRPLAIILTVALLLEGAYLIYSQIGEQPALSEAFIDSSPRAVAQVLFGDYLLPFELTSILLLVALIGAVVLTSDRKEQKR